MSHRKKKKNGIPDRWTDYQALGRRIPGTRFVAFKVPLKRSLRSLLPPTEAFGPLDLVQQLEEQQEELGLVIDLTYTTRYYTPEDLPNSVLYLKIFTAGHRVPSDPTILSFKRAVKSFLRENESNDKLIGVHCTHGLNRTGYLVCRYLIDVDGMDPAKAVEMFNCSRGHCIERENYLHDLQHGPKRSNKGMDKLEQKPIRGKADPQAWLPPHSEQETFDDSPCHSHYIPLHQWRGQNQKHCYPYDPPVSAPPFRMQPPRFFSSSQHWGVPYGARPPPGPQFGPLPIHQYVWPGPSDSISTRHPYSPPEGYWHGSWRDHRKLQHRQKNRP